MATFSDSIVKSIVPLTPTEVATINFEKTRNYSDLLVDTGERYEHYHPTTCREIMVSSLRSFKHQFDISEIGEYNYYLKIQASGEQYHLLAKAIKAVKNGEKVIEEFLSKILGEKYYIILGKARKDRAYTVSSKGITRSFPHTVTLVADVKKPCRIFPQNISLILALLREPRIHSKILLGSIANIKDLLDELINISYDRLRMIDDSILVYSNLSYQGLKKPTRKIYMALQKQESLQPFNSDGSDWCSILGLYLYLLRFNIYGSRFIENIEQEYNGPSTAGWEHTLFDNKIIRHIKGCMGKSQKLNVVVNSSLYLTSDGEHSVVIEYCLDSLDND